MAKDQLIQGLYDSIVTLDKGKALKLAKDALEEDVDISEVIEMGMSQAMQEVGRRFQCGEMFLPELQMSADVFQVAMDILQPKLMETEKDVKAPAKVIIGTVKGDLHSIGKNLVAIMLRTAGFEVVDLGVDVPTFTFLEEAEKRGADVIALSALLTTTMPRQGEIVEALHGQRIREKYKVIVGGGPVNQEWADRIGADGYGQTAADAIAVANRLLTQPAK